MRGAALRFASSVRVYSTWCGRNISQDAMAGWQSLWRARKAGHAVTRDRRGIVQVIREVLSFPTSRSLAAPPFHVVAGLADGDQGKTIVAIR